MKRKTAMALAFSMALVCAGCGAAAGDDDGQEDAAYNTDVTYSAETAESGNIPFNAQYFRTDGYVGGEEYPKAIWLASSAEFSGYCEANKDKYNLGALRGYDDLFFADQDLLVIVLEEGSGSIRHQVREVRVFPSHADKSSYCVQPVIERIVPEVGTCDMAEWHILIAVGKEYGLSHSETAIEFE